MQKAGPSNNWHYNPALKGKANALRKDMTKAEACLWKYVLKSKQMRGYQFRRQRPVLDYIADFMCKELLLVIEVDGITHHFDETTQNDNEKQAALEAAGFYVMRFSDEEVLRNIEGVKRRIETFVEDLEARLES